VTTLQRSGPPVIGLLACPRCGLVTLVYDLAAVVIAHRAGCLWAGEYTPDARTQVTRGGRRG
jgi:hypothetical protein